MTATTPEQVSAIKRMAADISWAKTPNRTERTAPARQNSPTTLSYWIARIRREGVVCEKDIPAAAENAHRAYMTRLSLRAVEARRRRAAATASR